VPDRASEVRHGATAQSPDSALARSVDSLFGPWSRTNTPGCAVGVDRGGIPVLRRAYGMSNLETGTPWTTGTLSESGSVAKQFTAAGLVLLAMDGVLRLDDDISRWIPEVKGFGKPITIRQLLTHTSGLPDRYTLHDVMGRPAGEVDHDNAEVLDVVSRLRELNFDPGEDYEYSNTGLIVAATVLERASGKSLEAFTDARIFRPLGMDRTRWREDHRVVVQGRASAYSGTLATGFRNDHPFTRVIGSGGLLTTVGDFLKWEAALQAGTGPWGAVRDSLERAGRLNDGTELTYGLGVGVSRWRGVRAVSHTGSTGGYRAALARYPEQNVAIALLCNLGSINPGTIANRVAALALGPALAPVPADPTGVAVDPQVLAGLAGAYYSPRTEQVMVLTVRNGGLVDSAGTVPLIPVEPARFRYRGGERTASFTMAAGGAAGLRVESPNTRAVEYVRVDRPTPDAAALAALAGEYRSPELDARLRLVANGDSLRIERGFEDPIRLTPLYRDGFSAGEAGIIRFVRDRRGRITGLVLWAGRVRHLRFERVPAVKP
ncbi:MAG TPA: serine hydrolase domain-containing protein, partial [Gemmatimonadales bacterium]|nr:serine hydrolase domain-containing protein [Gemmatimonadales bacterium]